MNVTCQLCKKKFQPSRVAHFLRMINGNQVFVHSDCWQTRPSKEADAVISELEKELDTMRSTFQHIHVNNGEDDSCLECGLDLRNPIHTRITELLNK